MNELTHKQWWTVLRLLRTHVNTHLYYTQDQSRVWKRSEVREGLKLLGLTKEEFLNITEKGHPIDH